MRVLQEACAIELRIHKTLEFCPDGVLAREILAEMREAGQEPGVGAYNSVLEAFSRRGALDDALDLFREMKEAGVDPTADTFDSLARPAARGGQYRLVEMLYKAKADGGALGPESLVVLLDAYANSIPRQAAKANSAFIDEFTRATTAGRDTASLASAEVLLALRRAVGYEAFATLCREYCLEAAAEDAGVALL